jgi:hypothetical protein
MIIMNPSNEVFLIVALLGRNLMDILEESGNPIIYWLSADLNGYLGLVREGSENPWPIFFIAFIS